MPPSGFSQRSINGLLVFVNATYEKTLEKSAGKELSEEKALHESIDYLNKLVENTLHKNSGFLVSNEGILGLKTFLAENYADLIKEIHQGKKPTGKAIQTEIENIRQYLTAFKM